MAHATMGIGLRMETTVPRRRRPSVTVATGNVGVVQRDPSEMASLAHGWDGARPKRVKVTEGGEVATRALDSATDSVRVEPGAGGLQTSGPEMKCVMFRELQNLGTEPFGPILVYGVAGSVITGAQPSSFHLYDAPFAASANTPLTDRKAAFGMPEYGLLSLTFPGPVRFDTGLSVRGIRLSDADGTDPLHPSATLTVFYRDA
jgi:hypothetical protein